MKIVWLDGITNVWYLAWFAYCLYKHSFLGCILIVTAYVVFTLINSYRKGK